MTFLFLVAQREIKLILPSRATDDQGGLAAIR